MRTDRSAGEVIHPSTSIDVRATLDRTQLTVFADYKVKFQAFLVPPPMFIDCLGCNLHLVGIESDTVREAWHVPLRRPRMRQLLLKSGASWDDLQLRLFLRAPRERRSATTESFAPLALPDQLPYLVWPDLARESAELREAKVTVRVESLPEEIALGGVAADLSRPFDQRESALQATLVPAGGQRSPYRGDASVTTAIRGQQAGTLTESDVSRVHALVREAAEFIARTLDVHPGLRLVADLVTDLPDGLPFGGVVSLPPNAYGIGEDEYVRHCMIGERVAAAWFGVGCSVRSQAGAGLVVGIASAFGLLWSQTVGNLTDLRRRLEGLKKRAGVPPAPHKFVRPGTTVYSVFDVALAVHERALEDSSLLPALGQFVRTNWGQIGPLGELEGLLREHGISLRSYNSP